MYFVGHSLNSLVSFLNHWSVLAIILVCLLSLVLNRCLFCSQLSHQLTFYSRNQIFSAKKCFECFFKIIKVWVVGWFIGTDDTTSRGFKFNCCNWMLKVYFHFGAFDLITWSSEVKTHVWMVRVSVDLWYVLKTNISHWLNHNDDFIWWF